ncbi:hypothetical protein DQW77_07690 [Roseovarius sp. TE539]|uniref:DUF6746 family protein n=1 Tax=Roseovarius sp. TE539 TaxID=2249812 RepID=UPI000DDE59E5|nr:DUF6746 family protein [Roseovarius sp. TE539]RBI74555.1 hypothetical protein DQW77_07690 [Roseovarius sp. TE539]
MRQGFHILATTMAVTLGGLTTAAADEAVDHYAPEPSKTLAEAVENFITYNNRMAEVLARDPLTVSDMEEVHRLTYTVEVALAKINEELGALAPVLEEVHLASEGDNPARLSGVAEVYLEKARVLDR